MMYVDEHEAGVIRRSEGWMTMSSSAESETQDPRRSQGDFLVELEASGTGPVDAELCKRLWVECAGRARFAAAVLGAAGSAGVPVEPETEAFADWVAELCPPLNLGLGAGDASAAAVLAQLSTMSETTALRVLTAVSDDLLGGTGIHDPESAVDRLEANGILIRMNDPQLGTRLQIPTLIAAKVRHDLAAKTGSGPVVASLLDVLIDHMESAGTVDADLLGDVLLLARHGGHWALLNRVTEAVGIPMFLLTPRTTCTAFRLLPPKIRVAWPILEFFGTLAEDIISAAPEMSPAGIRAAIVKTTGPGLLRPRLRGDSIDDDSSFRSPPDPFPSASACAEPLQTAVESSPVRRPADFIGTVCTMIRLADAGRHGEAAELGRRAAETIRSARGRSIIRLLTAIAFHRTASPRRALSLLNEIEGPARAGHVEGDFLLPAIIAWTALISEISGDHERADTHLAEAKSAEVIIDELVTPARRIAAALRALDRLDLDRVEEEYAALSVYPELRTLWVYLPFIARTSAVLSAEAEPGLLFVNDDAERFRDSGVLSDAEKDLLALGRSVAFIALGQLRWAEIDRERLSPSCDARIVLDVKSKLVAGRCADAISCADTWFYHRSLSPRSRAELAAIRAAAELRIGDEAAAKSDFAMAVNLCTWVSSLLPLALLPIADRERLIDLTTDSLVWEEAAAEFSETFATPADLISRLRSIGPVSVDVSSTPQLSEGEAQLIGYLAEGLSVAEIAGRLKQVSGTVKNRLSALYRKFGVSNRADVLIRARSFGYLA